MDKIKQKYIDDFIKPICNKVQEILLSKNMILPCALCGTTYAKIESDEDFIYYKLRCGCGFISKDTKIPISELTPAT